jgi:hypothetical protein
MVLSNAAPNCLHLAYTIQLPFNDIEMVGGSDREAPIQQVLQMVMDIMTNGLDLESDVQILQQGFFLPYGESHDYTRHFAHPQKC